MSMCYWMIEGIGIIVDDIIPYLDNRKMIKLISEQVPEDKEIQKWVNRIDVDGFDIEEYLHGRVFENIGDMLTYCDDTDSVTFGDDGEGTVYFYYPPSMPWHRCKNEPDSPEEVHRRIVKAVMAVTNMSAEKIEHIIDDDLCAVGCG